MNTNWVSPGYSVQSLDRATISGDSPAKRLTFHLRSEVDEALSFYFHLKQTVLSLGNCLVPLDLTTCG